MMYNEMKMCQSLATDMALDKITASKRKYVAPLAEVVELHLSGSVLDEGAGMGADSLGSDGEYAQSKKNKFSFFDDEEENTGDMTMRHQGVWE